MTSTDLDSSLSELKSLPTTLEQLQDDDDLLLQLDQELEEVDREQLDRDESSILELPLGLFFFLQLQQQPQPRPDLCEFCELTADVNEASFASLAGEDAGSGIGGNSFTVQSCRSLLCLPAKFPGGVPFSSLLLLEHGSSIFFSNLQMV